MTLRVLIPLLLSLCIGTAHSETLTGHPRVVDADTLAFDLERVRIEGIDAPEAKQTCRDAAGKEYPCGEVATEALRARINSNVVMCKGDSRDRYGRLICVRFFADGNNLNGGGRAPCACSSRPGTQDGPSKAGRGNGALQRHQDPTEIRLCPCLDL